MSSASTPPGWPMSISTGSVVVLVLLTTCTARPKAADAPVRRGNHGSINARNQTHHEAMPWCPLDTADELALGHDELLG